MKFVSICDTKFVLVIQYYEQVGERVFLITSWTSDSFYICD